MPAPTTRLMTRLESSLEPLQKHAVLGPLVRFYFGRREQILFVVVGGWNTLFGYGVWATLQLLIGGQVHYLVVVALAWPIAVLNAYLGYRTFVFNSEAPILQELPRFSAVYLATLLVNLALLPIALAAIPLNIYVIQALFTTAVVVASYLGHRYFSFGRGRHPGDPDFGVGHSASGSGG